MKLKLIYSASDVAQASVQTAPAHYRRIAMIVVIAFLALKLPLLTLDHNPEELRDYDHFARSAQGEYAYSDYVWLYGPLTPLVYGAALKILPDMLLSVRIVSLLFWALGAWLVAHLLARYLPNGSAVFWGSLVAMAACGYPGYSNNHILAAVAALGSLYFFVRYIDEVEDSALSLSFACAQVCLFTRPVLMGYGVFAAWWATFFWQKRSSDKLRRGIIYAIATLVSGLVFLLIYGKGLFGAFIPQSWAVLETKAYPNLHNLVVIPSLSDPDFVSNFAKNLRAALETAVFYGHYFVWPTFVGTLFFFFPQRRDVRAAAIAAFFGWFASLDMLHYGFATPRNEPAMWARGQYFFALTGLSLVILLWPIARGERGNYQQKYVSRALLLLVAMWGYFQWGIGATHLYKFPVNQHELHALTGILTNPGKSGVLEAVAFINSQCQPTDKVVVPQYDPGLARVLNCEEMFGKDSYLFTRMPWYQLKPGETPYLRDGGMTNEALILSRIASENPRFYLFEAEPPMAAICHETGWQSKTFGTGPQRRTVCWRTT